MRSFYFLFLLLPVTGFSQTYRESWIRINVTHPVDSHWSVAADFQYRTQNNYTTKDKNLFHYSLGYSARLWIYYHLKNEWKLVLSPFAYFISKDIPENTGTAEKEDIRIMTGAIKSFTGDRWRNRNRLLYELRFADFNSPESYIQMRYRLQNNLVVPFHKNRWGNELGYFLSNEFMVQTSNGKTSFDQNRIYNALQCKRGKSDITMGYQWVVQKGKTVFYRNQFLIVLNASI